MVSIVVPSFNSAEGLKILIPLLLQQTYPKGLLEIIIVDNLSDDETREILEKFPVISLSAPEMQNSYWARNRGVLKASGTVLAFLDADCQPKADWLANGIRGLIENDVDIVGGHIHIPIGSSKCVAEIYDSLCFLRHEYSIPYRRVAFTANLFVKKRVFEALGGFVTNSPFNGDVLFSADARLHGYKMIYIPSAMIHHPPRNRRSVLVKAYCIGYSKSHAFKTSLLKHYTPGKRAHFSILGFSYLSRIGRLLNINKFHVYRLWLFSLLVLIVSGLGAISGLFCSYPQPRGWRRSSVFYNKKKENILGNQQ